MIYFNLFSYIYLNLMTWVWQVNPSYFFNWFFSSTLSLNIVLIENLTLYFFYLFSMRLSRSYDPGCKFCEVACRLRFFGLFFNRFFLYILSFNIELIKNSTLFFFILSYLSLMIWFWQVNPGWLRFF
jgi:hypothetical protein